MSTGTRRPERPDGPAKVGESRTADEDRGEVGKLRRRLRRAQRLYRELVRSAEYIVYRTDDEGRLTYANAAAARITGYPLSKLIGMDLLELLHPDYREQMIRSLRERMAPGGKGGYIEVPILTAGGDQVWLGQSLQALRHGPAPGVQSIGRDVTHSRRMQEENQRLAALTRQNPNPVLECDRSGTPISFNPATQEIVRTFGLTSIREMLPAEHEELILASLERRRGESTVEVEVGERVFAWTYHPYSQADTVHLFATDITSQRGMEERLRHEALHDALTGLPNRVLFMERLEHVLLRDKRQTQPLFAVLFLDLDRFKVVNDSLGHHSGDELLVTVADRIRGCLRPTDTIARFGGDEFAILLEEMHEVADATRVAERIQQALAQPVQVGGTEVFTTASIGIALSTIGHDTAELLLRDADMAMYRAKGGGQARVEIFDRAMHAEAVARLKLETDLRRAVDRREFTLHYQPIVSLADGQVIAVEALVRWVHPAGGLLMPDRFTRVAEETGVIADIGRWVLNEACRQVAEWRQRYPAHHDLGVGVNLSARQLSNPALVDQVREALELSKLPPGALKLEISESALMSDVEEASEILSRLKSVGVDIYIDDFGTGFSSLNYLHRLPLDALKVDRTFIGRMEGDELTRQLVRTMLRVAEGIGAMVIAEGIETRRQLERLRELGCRAGQGHYIVHPVPTDLLEHQLAG